MSAWALLVHWDGSDEFLKLCNEAMKEIQTVHAHKLAKAIRMENPDRSDDWSNGAEWAADLIDPEVSS